MRGTRLVLGPAVGRAGGAHDDEGDVAHEPTIAIWTQINLVTMLKGSGHLYMLGNVSRETSTR